MATESAPTDLVDNASPSAVGDPSLPSTYLPTTDLGDNESYRFDVPNVDTSIDPSEFASGAATELAPPEDIDAAEIGAYTPYTADDERTVGAESTVEGRLSGLLSQNNPYIERARLEGKQYANKAGMLNTSMGAGASMGAAIDRALPIAQQDARANLEQSFLNQGYSNEEAKHLADSTITRENLQAGLDQDTNQYNADRSFEADKINAAENNKNNFATLTADLQGQLAGIDNQLAMNLESLSREYAIMENLDTINGAIYKEMVAGMATILANEDKVSVAKSKINNLIEAANIELAFSNGSGSGSGVGGEGGPQTLDIPDEPPPASSSSTGDGGGKASDGPSNSGNGGIGSDGTAAGDDSAGGFGGFGPGQQDADGNGDGGDGDGDGDGGGGGTCFAKGTLFKMEDGSTKAIDKFEVGDRVKGGEVTEVIQGQASSVWYDYHGTSVTDEHFVLERGTWKYVMDSEDAVEIEPNEQYYTAITTNHELFDEHGNTFSDHNVFDYSHPAMDIEGYYCDALLEMKNGNTEAARKIMAAGAQHLADMMEGEEAA